MSGAKITPLDHSYGAMQDGDEAAGLVFWQAMADATLYMLLTSEAVGAVLSPAVFDLPEGPVVLAFDTEERLAAFSDRPQAYAALPGRIIAAQMAGQGLSLGLNLGSGAPSEALFGPEALTWLVAMLQQDDPVARVAHLAGLGAPDVPPAVVAALTALIAGKAGLVGAGYLVSVAPASGPRGHLLALTGTPLGAEVALARAVTEALAFSGIEAAALDVVFLPEGDAQLTAIARVGLRFDATPAPVDPPRSTTPPGMDPTRPPILR